MWQAKQVSCPAEPRARNELKSMLLPDGCDCERRNNSHFNNHCMSFNSPVINLSRHYAAAYRVIAANYFSWLYYFPLFTGPAVTGLTAPPNESHATKADSNKVHASCDSEADQNADADSDCSNKKQRKPRTGKHFSSLKLCHWKVTNLKNFGRG